MPTRKPIEAIEYAKNFVKNSPIERVQLAIIQDTYNYLWFSAPWRWTVGDGLSFPLVANNYEYVFNGTPPNNAPADYNYLIKATLITDDNSQTQVPLEVVANLPAQPFYGPSPTQIAEKVAAIPDGAVTYRVHPVKKTLTGTNTVVTLYKKFPRKWDPKTIYTTSVEFPDEWFYVYEALVLQKAYQYANDDRAGQATVNPVEGSIVLNGQRALAEAEVQLMKEREKPFLIIQSPAKEQKDFRK